VHINRNFPNAKEEGGWNQGGKGGNVKREKGVRIIFPMKKEDRIKEKRIYLEMKKGGLGGKRKMADRMRV